MSNVITKPKATTPEALAARYEVSEEFLRAYLRGYGEMPAGRDLSSWWSSLTEVQRLHADYALSTNQRARAVHARCAPHLSQGARRHLDIGCGYGGTLRAFGAAGFRCTGIEIDPALFQLCEVNCAGRDIRVLNRDVTGLDPAELGGEFDVITCNAVIEHVSDPPGTMARIARLLAPGGLLMMETPNRDSIEYVKADGHFLLFGLTLLSRQEAREMKRAMTGQDDPYHHMGEYYALAFYANHLDQVGLQPWIDPNPAYARASLPERLVTLMQAHAAFAARTDLPFFSRQLLQERFATYCAALFAALRRAQETGDWQPFEERYLTDFWCVMARKPGG